MSSAKRLLFFLAILTMMTLNLLSQPYQATVNVRFLDVHEEMNTESKVLRTLSKGVRVSVLKIQNEWCYIVVEEKNGWVKKSDLTIENYNEEEVVIEKEPTQVRSDSRAMEQEKVSNKEKVKFIDLSVWAGPTFSTLLGDDVTKVFDEEHQFKTGLLFGGGLSFYVVPMLAITSEWQWVMKGGNSKFKGEDVSVRLDYIEFPILFRISSSDKFSFETYVNIGVVPSINTLKLLELADGNYEITDIKSFDLGYTIGLGFAKQYAKINYFAEIRATVSSSSIFEKNPDTNYEYDITNGYYSVKLGLSYNILEK